MFKRSTLEQYVYKPNVRALRLIEVSIEAMHVLRFGQGLLLASMLLHWHFNCGLNGSKFT
jgi:hypothetical protein